MPNRINVYIQMPTKIRNDFLFFLHLKIKNWKFIFICNSKETGRENIYSRVTDFAPV